MKRTAISVKEEQQMFETAYRVWSEGHMTQAEAAEMLGMCVRTFQRHMARFEDEGEDWVLDRRVGRACERAAPLDEVQRLLDDYQDGHGGWNVRHYYERRYKPDVGGRSYNWVRTSLQEAGLVERKKPRGKHRLRRDRKALPGMMIHQDASTHEWVPGQSWDLVATMDDATSEVTSLFFCEEEGTWSSLRGLRETIQANGLPCSMYVDRASHYAKTPKADGPVDKGSLTQVGRALAELGIELIHAYSPEARGRSERAFRTHQGRLPQELAKAGITGMEAANRYLQEVYLPAHNKEFTVPAAAEGTAFVPVLDARLDDILCERHGRTVGGDNCVRFRNLRLQIPANRHRMNYIKVKVKVLLHEDRTISVYHGPLLLARYTADGQLLDKAADGRKEERATA